MTRFLVQNVHFSMSVIAHDKEHAKQLVISYFDDHNIRDRKYFNDWHYKENKRAEVLNVDLY